MTVPVDQRSKRLPEPPNVLLSLPAHFANLNLPILQHNVSVEVHHGECRRDDLRKTGLGIDHECVEGLESQRIDIAGMYDDFLVMNAHSVDEEIHSGIPFEGKGEPGRLVKKLLLIGWDARNELLGGYVFGSWLCMSN